MTVAQWINDGLDAPAQARERLVLLVARWPKTPMTKVSSVKTVSNSPTKRLFALGNFSKFVRPGWVRIDTTGSKSGVYGLTAFKNPSTGDFALVVINSSGASMNVKLALSGATATSVTPYQTYDDGSGASVSVGSRGNLRSRPNRLPSQSPATVLSRRPSPMASRPSSVHRALSFALQIVIRRSRWVPKVPVRSKPSASQNENGAHVFLRDAKREIAVVLLAQMRRQQTHRFATGATEARRLSNRAAAQSWI